MERSGWAGFISYSREGLAVSEVRWDCPYERRPFPFVRRCPFVRLGLSLRATRRTAGTSSFPLGAARPTAGIHTYIAINMTGEERTEGDGRGEEVR